LRCLPTWTRICSERTCSIPIALPHYPLDRADKPLGTAPELVVKPEPPEQDLNFTTDAAETWFEENDPEGVGFEYEVLE
jgi:hypothetical protein